MTTRLPGTGALEHPAVRAWAKLGPERVEPRGVERLQKRKKGVVYRLEGVGPDGSDVVAKRSSPERIARERPVFEYVLSVIPVPGLRYYGCVEEPDDECAWLFLEDAGDEEYSPCVDAHRTLAARWLALVHTSAARVAAAAARLSDRGPAYYLEQLRSAHDTIVSHLGNPALTAGDVAVLARIARQCEIVASYWRTVELRCEGMRRTLVHGDFAPKNMRVRRTRGELSLLPFDWGSAGWGIPAADLVQPAASPHGGARPELTAYWASPDLDVYCTAVRESWSDLDVRTLQQLAVIGKVFRCLVCVSLDAQSLATEWVEGSMANMRLYEAEMVDAIRAAEWGDG